MTAPRHGSTRTPLRCYRLIPPAWRFTSRRNAERDPLPPGGSRSPSPAPDQDAGRPRCCSDGGAFQECSVLT